MTEVVEGVSVAEPEPPEEKEEERTPLKIRCALFFDGTLNNRDNTESRQLNTTAYETSKK